MKQKIEIPEGIYGDVAVRSIVFIPSSEMAVDDIVAHLSILKQINMENKTLKIKFLLANQLCEAEFDGSCGNENILATHEYNIPDELAGNVVPEIMYIQPLNVAIEKITTDMLSIANANLNSYVTSLFQGQYITMKANKS